MKRVGADFKLSARVSLSSTMGTIQFEKIYYGLSPETGSKLSFLNICKCKENSVMNLRSSHSSQRDGLESH
jgi:hypothetical protein